MDVCGTVAILYAPVAQLDRVTDSDSVGRWFESSRAYQKGALQNEEFCNAPFITLFASERSGWLANCALDFRAHS